MNTEKILYLKEYQQELIEYKLSKGWKLVDRTKHDREDLRYYHFTKEQI
jgi:hypothetical protein